MAILKTEATAPAGTVQTAKPQFVRFAFYRINPAFRKLDSNVRLAAKEQMLSAIELYKESMIVLPYSMLATRSDADMLLWQISPDLELFEEFAGKLLHTSMASYLEMTHSYLALSKNAIYDEHGTGKDGKIKVGDLQFVFLYPFTRTAEWHQLAAPDKKKLNEEYAAIAAKHPNVRVNIATSMGLDDQEGIVICETDSTEDFIQMSKEFSEAKASRYLLYRAHSFTCISKDPKLILDSLG